MSFKISKKQIEKLKVYLNGQNNQSNKKGTKRNRDTTSSNK